MSGGHFNYEEWHIEAIADSINIIIARSGDAPEPHYPPEVIERFREAAATLRRAYWMTRAVDRLVCADTGNGTFMEEWEAKRLDDAADLESWLQEVMVKETLGDITDPATP